MQVHRLHLRLVAAVLAALATWVVTAGTARLFKTVGQRQAQQLAAKFAPTAAIARTAVEAPRARL
jgi:hypothetical protein